MRLYDSYSRLYMSISLFFVFLLKLIDIMTINALRSIASIVSYLENAAKIPLRAHQG